MWMKTDDTHHSDRIWGRKVEVIADSLVYPFSPVTTGLFDDWQGRRHIVVIKAVSIMGHLLYVDRRGTLREERAD